MKKVIKEKRDVPISFRCTKEESKLLHEKAKSQDKSLTDYILDEKIPEREEIKARIVKDEKEIALKVETQQALNDLHLYISEKYSDSALMGLLNALEEKGAEVWGF